MYNENYVKIGRIVRKWITNEGLYFKDVANEMGISQPAFSDMMRGRTKFPRERIEFLIKRFCATTSEIKQIQHLMHAGGDYDLTMEGVPTDVIPIVPISQLYFNPVTSNIRTYLKNFPVQESVFKKVTPDNFDVFVDIPLALNPSFLTGTHLLGEHRPLRSGDFVCIVFLNKRVAIRKLDIRKGYYSFFYFEDGIFCDDFPVMVWDSENDQNSISCIFPLEKAYIDTFSIKSTGGKISKKIVDDPQAIIPHGLLKHHLQKLDKLKK